MTAIPLIFGRLGAVDYEDDVAADPRIDALRNKMEVTENKQFTVAYHDPDKRAIGNSVQVFFRDGSSTDRIVVGYPVGHRRRRGEGIPLLLDKFRNAVTRHFSAARRDAILAACEVRPTLEAMPVNEFMELWTKPSKLT